MVSNKACTTLTAASFTGNIKESEQYLLALRHSIPDGRDAEAGKQAENKSLVELTRSEFGDSQAIRE
jgi:hypothetical protein